MSPGGSWGDSWGASWGDAWGGSWGGDQSRIFAGGDDLEGAMRAELDRRRRERVVRQNNQVTATLVAMILSGVLK